MCGVPFHSCEGYIARLVAKGYKVAICEQLEDPAKAKGLVKRDVIRVITPGTVNEPSMLDETQNSYIGAVYRGQSATGVAMCDISTGEAAAVVVSSDDDALINELSVYSPKELIVNYAQFQRQRAADFVKERLNGLFQPLDDGSFDYAAGCERIEKQFSKSISELGLEDKPEAVMALGCLLDYLTITQKVELRHINRLSLYSKSQYLEMDSATRRNLEICETMRQKQKRGSLLGVLDSTRTAMGGRLLRKWIEQPLIDAARITRRHKAVDVLCRNTVVREELAAKLDGLYDAERLISRIVYGTANGRDLIAISATLRAVPRLKELLTGLDSSELNEINSDLIDLNEVYGLIDRAICDEPPFVVRDGNVIRAGYNEEVDRLRDMVQDTKGYIARLEAAEKEKTGIPKLKVGYNRVFGYYIEISRSYISQAPDSYIRKQTLANCERYITQELKDFENTVMTAQEKLTALEIELFDALRDGISQFIPQMQRIAAAVARLDVLCSFARVAVKNDYCMPDVDYSGRISITQGRHPVVETTQKSTLFVPNDAVLDGSDNRLMLITGPNMAGKSTYMRQVALIVLMAQAGSFVPAKSASISICDKIFTRVGASDDLSAGQSTFMVEMSEVANILKNATSNSLIIFDEIGRGTSTYDGLSIAQAVLEYSADKRRIGAKVLFATHYHELTELEGVVDGVKNYCVSVKKRGDDIIFLRRIIRGAADDSYGIEVAKLAGVPDKVTKRAKEILKKIESGEGNLLIPKRLRTHEEDNADQMLLVSGAQGEIADKLRLVDVNTLTPLEAMNLLFQLKQLAEQ